MLAAPLIAGNDVRSMPPAVREVLTNRDVVAIDQDSLGVQGWPYEATLEGVEVWFKPLAGGDWGVAVLNPGGAPRAVTFDWKREYVSDDLSKRSADFGTVTYALRDLWA